LRLGEIGWVLGPSPLFLPGIAISILISRSCSARVGRALSVGRRLAFALLLSVGLIASATLTPSPEALGSAVTGTNPPNYHTSCDISRIGPPPLESLIAINDDSLNVLLFVPLGTLLALLPGSRRKAALVVAAIALPVAIEAIQLVIPQLDRACQTSDIADNLTGLVAGLAIGTVAGLVARGKAVIGA
jgi:VanZ family protein